MVPEVLVCAGSRLWSGGFLVMVVDLPQNQLPAPAAPLFAFFYFGVKSLNRR